MRMTDLRSGWPVLGNDGRRVGTIRDVGKNYLVTARGLFAQDLFIPVSAVANVENDTVYLNLTQRDAEQMGWEQEPREDDAREGTEGDLHRHV